MKFEERVLQEEFQLNDTDDEIIQYIRTNRTKFKGLSIQKMAKDLFVAPNAIMRLTKKLGYSGFADLKSQIQAENEKDMEGPSLLSQSLIKTLDLMDQKKMDVALSKMLHARNIHFIGVGDSLYYCQMMVDNLGAVDKKAYCYKTYREIEYYLTRCQESDLVVVISASGENPRINSLLEEVKKNKCYIISITHFCKNTTSSIANLPIYFWGEDYRLNGYNITDRTGMMIVLRELSEMYWRA